jgi:hypothetical protein
MPPPPKDDGDPAAEADANPNYMLREYLIARVPVFEKLTKLRNDV